MNLETMLYESDGDLIRLTLNRPHALNAVNYQGTLELHEAAQAIHDDPAARAVIIRGAGRAFCAGIDLKELAAGETPHDYFYQWDRALRLLELSDKLVLCAMQGYALGGGLQLPLACDIRIATADCQLGLPAAKEGFHSRPRHLPPAPLHRAGQGQADGAVGRERGTANEALRIGLVDYVVDADNFDAEVEALTQRLPVHQLRGGAADQADAVGLPGLPPTAPFFEEYLRRQSIAMASPDHLEALAAMSEGGQPDYRRR